MAWSLYSGAHEWRVVRSVCSDSVVAAVRRTPGWLPPIDAAAISILSALQTKRGIEGPLLEIGVYQGKSAILLGGLLRSAERLHVCDPFGGPVSEPINQEEILTKYGGLAASQFERRYLSVHALAPQMYICPSSELRGRLDGERAFRIVHIDGSHLFDPVRQDLELSQEVLVAKSGLVICDDYRKPSTPGIPAAIWQAVGRGLSPVLLTAGKFYGCWQPNPLYQPSLIAEEFRQVGLRCRLIDFQGHSVALLRDQTPLLAIPGIVRQFGVRTVAPAAKAIGGRVAWKS